MFGALVRKADLARCLIRQPPTSAARQAAPPTLVLNIGDSDSDDDDAWELNMPGARRQPQADVNKMHRLPKSCGVVPSKVAAVSLLTMWQDKRHSSLRGQTKDKNFTCLSLQDSISDHWL